MTLSRTLLIASSLLLPSLCLADSTALTDDGRQVILKADGQWQYDNDKRLATDAQGRRIWLKDNGNWQILPDAPAAPIAQLIAQQPTEVVAGLTIANIVTQEYKKKRGTRVQYQTQTLIHLEGLSAKNHNAVLNAGNTSIKISDDKGVDYPIVNISADDEQLSAIILRVDGSPRGSLRFGTKQMEVTLSKSLLGQATDSQLVFRTSDITYQKVDKPFN